MYLSTFFFLDVMKIEVNQAGTPWLVEHKWSKSISPDSLASKQLLVFKYSVILEISSLIKVIEAALCLNAMKIL